MTITAQTNRYSYSGNGVTTAFAYSSKFLANGDLVVIETVDATGVSTTKTITTHYTVTGAGDANGGTVTMVTAPASGVTLTLYGDPALTQTVDLVEGDDLAVETQVEAPLDRLTLIARRLKDRLDRTARLADDDTSGADVTLPAPVAGTALGWNEDADALVNLTDAAAFTDLVSVSAYMLTVLDDANAATARTTLGAVGLTGNETVAGDKTFSGTTVVSGSLTASTTLAVTGVTTHTGTVYIGDTANASSTLGLTINQAGADNEILSFKSSDVAHGVTDITETDTFGFVKKHSAASGGLRVTGVIESGQAPGLYLQAYTSAASTTAATNALAMVMTGAIAYSGASVADVAANTLVFGVECRKGGSDQAVFFVDEDGDLFNDGASGTSTTYDAWNDAALARAFDQAVAPGAVIRSQWDEHVNYKREDLVRAGILTDPKDGGRPMVNITQLQRLHNGAIWQLYTQMQEQAQIISEQAKQLAAISRRLLPE